VTATELIVVGRGKLIASGTVEELIHHASTGVVRVRTAEAERLSHLLAGQGRHIDHAQADILQVSGMDSAAIGVIAAREGIALIELTPQQATLEEAFLEITRDSVEFHGGLPVADHAGAATVGGASQ
jgi:ABC-2 type transport system ATP-binding protein